MKHILPIKIDTGPGKGSTIVLLHGLGNNHKSWTYVLKALNFKSYRVVAFDLLGFGDAPKPKKCDYTPEDHADAVINTLESMKIEQVVLAGHSMGSIVAIAVAKKRPDLVERMVLLGAPLYKKMPRPTLFRFHLRFWRVENAYGTIFNALAKNPTMTITAASSLKIVAPLLKGMEITEETWPAFRASLRSTIMQTESYKDMLTMEIPTLLMYGKLDFFVIKRNLKRLARKNKKFVRFESVLGPHEITPFHGKSIAELLQKEAKK